MSAEKSKGSLMCLLAFSSAFTVSATCQPFMQYIILENSPERFLDNSFGSYEACGYLKQWLPDPCGRPALHLKIKTVPKT